MILFTFAACGIGFAFGLEANLVVTAQLLVESQVDGSCSGLTGKDGPLHTHQTRQVRLKP